MATYEPPHLDAKPVPVDSQQVDPFYDLRIASKNYWAGRTGREEPPAPTFRDIGGKKLLGRYMDPYGCQAHLQTQRQLWRSFYTWFLGGLIVSIIVGPETDFIGTVVGAAILATWYLSVKAKHRRQYWLYYGVQDQILQTGEPAWVPYDKTRLKLIDENPLAVWP